MRILKQYINGEYNILDTTVIQLVINTIMLVASIKLLNMWVNPWFNMMLIYPVLILFFTISITTLIASWRSAYNASEPMSSIGSFICILHTIILALILGAFIF